MTADSRLIDMTACDVVDLLQRQEVTPLDLLDTLEDRISDVTQP